MEIKNFKTEKLKYCLLGIYSSAWIVLFFAFLCRHHLKANAMKYLKYLPIVGLFLALTCDLQEYVLIKVYEGEYDEISTKTGYMNIVGDTIIPLGKYYYCYTDTFRTYAIVMTKEKKCIAIDRQERKLFEVYWYDNGPDYPQEGLFRIKRDGKIGYANEAGEIVIAPQFACANPFEDGKAKVTYACELVPDGDYTMQESDEWFYINKNGQAMDN